MKWYEKIWNWLNGNKTMIGLALGFLLTRTWFVNLVGPEVAEVIDWLAVTFLGVGIAHKVTKSNTQPGPNI